MAELTNWVSDNGLSGRFTNLSSHKYLQDYTTKSIPRVQSQRLGVVVKYKKTISRVIWIFEGEDGKILNTLFLMRKEMLIDRGHR